MKRETDFAFVRQEHIAIHERLLNWARVVRVSQHGRANVHPMFRHYRHGYEEPSSGGPRVGDGWATEKLVVDLPEKNRAAIQWAYVYPYIPIHKARRALGVTEAGLLDLIHVGRTMLKNRSV